MPGSLGQSEERMPDDVHGFQSPEQTRQIVKTPACPHIQHLMEASALTNSWRILRQTARVGAEETVPWHRHKRQDYLAYHQRPSLPQ